MTGDFDPAVTAYIIGRLSPGGTFIDVGANIGWYAFRAAQIVGQGGRVLAVEVDSRALRCLQRTAHHNSDLPIDIAAIAADHADGFAHLRMATECGHSVLSVSDSDRLVPTRTLDSLVKSKGYHRVDLLKIDVEGAELRVLKGATDLLRQFRPRIVCELIPENLEEQGDSVGGLNELLLELGYSVAPLPGVWSPTIVCDTRSGQ
jgi:FkbM family methyltransferase